MYARRYLHDKEPQHINGQSAALWPTSQVAKRSCWSNHRHVVIMGNLVLNCVPVIPSEEGQDVDDLGDDTKSGPTAGSRAGRMGPARLMSEVECIHDPPTTITRVLSNALYAMAFHKHLALT